MWRPKTTWLAVMAAAVFLAGCEPVLSLHPLFDAGQRVAVPALEGTWVEDMGGLTLTLRRASDNTYEFITVDEDQKKHRLRAQLGRLGRNIFLDASPSDRSIEGLQLPAHAFFRVRLEGDSLELAYLDDDWLRGMLRDKKLAIAHEILGTGIVLTAPSRDLQALARKYAADPDAFTPLRFNRPKPQGKQAPGNHRR